jgi:hypothetical protein
LCNDLDQPFGIYRRQAKPAVGICDGIGTHCSGKLPVKQLFIRPGDY